MEFKERRDYLVPALRTLRFDITQRPQGAFYIYAGCGGLTSDNIAFAPDLVEIAGVAITPGIDFGANAPGRHVRFAYTSSIERLKEGVRRIGEFLRCRWNQYIHGCTGAYANIYGRELEYAGIWV